LTHQVTETAPARDYSFLEEARRASRFKAALERVSKIAETGPRFTDDQLEQLAGVFLAARACSAPAPAHTCGETGYTSTDICIACRIETKREPAA
jgi:hypothetical protein